MLGDMSLQHRAVHAPAEKLWWILLLGTEISALYLHAEQQIAAAERLPDIIEKQ
jgi:hypothetical protein